MRTLDTSDRVLSPIDRFRLRGCTRPLALSSRGGGPGRPQSLLRSAAAGLAAAAVAGAASASAAALGIVAIERGTSAVVTSSSCSTPLASESSDELGLFLSSVESGSSCPALATLALASQDSLVERDLVRAAGSASSAWSSDSVWKNAVVESLSEVGFVVAPTEPVRLAFSGALSKALSADFSGSLGLQVNARLEILALEGQSLEQLFSASVGLQPEVVLEESAVLPPGSYIVSLTAHNLVNVAGTVVEIATTSAFDVQFESLSPADLNGDSQVDGADVGALLAAWGPCGTCNPFDCSADLNGDCAVDGADLGLLASEWAD